MLRRSSIVTLRTKHIPVTTPVKFGSILLRKTFTCTIVKNCPGHDILSLVKVCQSCGYWSGFDRLSVSSAWGAQFGDSFSEIPAHVPPFSYWWFFSVLGKSWCYQWSLWEVLKGFRQQRCWLISPWNFGTVRSLLLCCWFFTTMMHISGSRVAVVTLSVRILVE